MKTPRATKDQRRLLAGDTLFRAAAQFGVPRFAEEAVDELRGTQEALARAMQSLQAAFADQRSSRLAVQAEHSAFARAVRAVADELVHPVNGARDSARHVQVLAHGGRLHPYVRSARLDLASEAPCLAARAREAGIDEAQCSSVEKAGQSLVRRLVDHQAHRGAVVSCRTENRTASRDWDRCFRKVRTLLKVALPPAELVRFVPKLRSGSVGVVTIVPPPAPSAPSVGTTVGQPAPSASSVGTTVTAIEPTASVLGRVGNEVERAG